MQPTWVSEGGEAALYLGDCREIAPTLGPVDAVVCDPPYGLEFMGKEWDAPWQVSSKSALFGQRKTAMPGWGSTRNANCRACGGRMRGENRCACDSPEWDEAPNATVARQMGLFQDWCQEWSAACLPILKPGAHLLAFGGTRTYHRLACAVEDAGFEVRDQLAWVYGSGFPKSLDVSKAIDKAAGAEREQVGTKRISPTRPAHGKFNDDNYEWKADVPITAPASEAAKKWVGWGTALKPAWEPIVLARKPLAGTVAANVSKHGTGALNIDACRVGTEGGSTQPSGMDRFNARLAEQGYRPGAYEKGEPAPPVAAGRWPANLIHDGSEEVLEAFAAFGQRGGGGRPRMTTENEGRTDEGQYRIKPTAGTVRDHGDSGSAARFFYCAKASRRERGEGNTHPTVKPLALMGWLTKMVCPEGGLILDPFGGSGTTAIAAVRAGRRVVLIERDPAYFAIARARITAALAARQAEALLA